MYSKWEVVYKNGDFEVHHYGMPDQKPNAKTWRASFLLKSDAETFVKAIQA